MQQAYETLADPARRAAYDVRRATPLTGQVVPAKYVGPPTAPYPPPQQVIVQHDPQLLDFLKRTRAQDESRRWIALTIALVPLLIVVCGIGICILSAAAQS